MLLLIKKCSKMMRSSVITEQEGDTLAYFRKHQFLFIFFCKEIIILLIQNYNISTQ